MAVMKLTQEMAEQAVRDTDWAALDAQTDEDIARNVAADPDAAPILTEAETIAYLRVITAKSDIVAQVLGS